MNKTLIGAAAVALGVTGALAFVTSPASAEPGSDCRTVAVNLTERPDNGSHGVWANDTMTRTLKVCMDNDEPVEGKYKYHATVTDSGTFTTVKGKSPHDGVPLAAGITGTFNGGFRATLTAPAWHPDFALTSPEKTTPSGEWVATAFPGATGVVGGTYRYAYKNACESYTDNNGTYTGDITVHCVTPTAPTYTAPTCTAYGVVKLPKQDGVKYDGRRVDGKAVVTATTEAGYTFPKGTKTEWAYDVAKLTGPQCEPTTPPTTTPPATPSATPSATPTSTTAAPVPSDTESTPVGAALPVTGDGGGTNVALISALGGTAMIALGGALLVWQLRRRRDTAEFVA